MMCKGEASPNEIGVHDVRSFNLMLHTLVLRIVANAMLKRAVHSDVMVPVSFTNLC